MKNIINKLEDKGISLYKYKEDNKVCGYELNTYTELGLNQIVFIDFRDTDKNPNSEKDFKELFLDFVNNIDVDYEIDINRQNKEYKETFTIRESLNDITDWKIKLLNLAKSL